MCASTPSSSAFSSPSPSAAETVHAFAAEEKRAGLKPFTYATTAPGPFQVEIDITHCGICHSDLHLIDNDWGISRYPLVPGHEIVGHVRRAGPNVALVPGTRVGVGWQRSACLECEECITGRENLCLKHEDTCVGHHGGFATRITVDARFVYPLPESLSSESCAPLLCAGVTVFTPLTHFRVQPGHRVGIIGIGGLGHLALQFARSMGCEVTAFSSSPDKEAEARAYGAHHFVPITRENLKSMRRSQDFLLNTVMVEQDWHGFVQTLRTDGNLCFVGAPNRPLSLPLNLLLDARRTISGSVIGGRNDMQRMLHFAARHGIRAQTECIPLSQVNEGLQKVRENRARYRMVLTMGGQEKNGAFA